KSSESSSESSDDSEPVDSSGSSTASGNVQGPLPPRTPSPDESAPPPSPPTAPSRSRIFKIDRSGRHRQCSPSPLPDDYPSTTSSPDPLAGPVDYNPFDSLELEGEPPGLMPDYDDDEDLEYAGDQEGEASADELNIGDGDASFVASAMSQTDPEPRSFAEAMASPFADQWAEAMRSEYASLLGKQVFERVKLPPGKKAIGS
ncbi:hypothetical protein HWV62_9587, partial [Athelia sp. TMB]